MTVEHRLSPAPDCPADRMQALAYANTPSVMWGQFTVPTGYRSTLSGLIESSFPMFWQVDKAAK